jgi:hypothetical protein
MRLRDEGLSWQDIDGETILLDLHSSTYFKTNKTGTHLLHLLVEDRDRSELVQALVDAYGLSMEQADLDVDAFLGHLSQRGLLS